MTTKKTTEVAKVTKDITAQVLEKVQAFQGSGELTIPEDYSVENAIKSAYLVLKETKNKAGKTALEACSKSSIANALLKMVVWGLSPMKKQCDFIMYGDKLECQMEYTGNIALAKRWGGLADIKANAVFEGDDFAFAVDPETGRKYIVKHSGSLSNLGKQQVVGAYAVATMKDGSSFAEVMSIEQIKAAWNQGATKGASPAHKNFPDQMAIKTVISRACKLLIRGSDDSILFNSDEVRPSNSEVVDKQIEHEIDTNANVEDMDFEEVQEQPKEETQTKVDKDGQANFDGPGF